MSKKKVAEKGLEQAEAESTARPESTSSEDSTKDLNFGEHMKCVWEGDLNRERVEADRRRAEHEF